MKSGPNPNQIDLTDESIPENEPDECDAADDVEGGGPAVRVDEHAAEGESHNVAECGAEEAPSDEAVNWEGRK